MVFVVTISTLSCSHDNIHIAMWVFQYGYCHAHMTISILPCEYDNVTCHWTIWRWMLAVTFFSSWQTRICKMGTFLICLEDLEYMFPHIPPADTMVCCTTLKGYIYVFQIFTKELKEETGRPCLFKSKSRTRETGCTKTSTLLHRVMWFIFFSHSWWRW